VKRIVFASILAISLLSFATSPTVGAQTAGQAASGTYQFLLGDDYLKSLDFDATIQADGTTLGSMLLSDDAPVSYQDVDGTGDPSAKDEYKGFYIKAELDGLVINKNQAVMSGTIRDSSIPVFVGQRVLLTVEDNGDNTKVPDKLAWGIYRPSERRWTPSDAEWKEDPGVGLRWIATDVERKDDVGVPYPKPDAVIDCQSFPVSSYSFVNVSRASGDIKVQP
jgi:hypothetical protein